MADAITTAQQSSGATATRLSPKVRRRAGRNETVELSRTCRTIAELLHESLRTTAQLTAVVDVDMTHLMGGVRRSRRQRAATHGGPLTRLAPTAHALCRVLGRHPVLNASIELGEGTATYHRDVHLGIAVDTEHGLVAPTVWRAQDVTTAALSERIADLAVRARSSDPAPDELGGDALAIHQMSYLCLTYDHRSVDGADAARFLTDLKHELETADLLGGAA